MQAIGFLAYLALGIVQIAATCAGLQAWLGLNLFLALLVALFLGYLPLIGTVLGFFGAMNVWGWEWWQAGLLFFGGLVTVLALGGLASLGKIFSRQAR